MDFDVDIPEEFADLIVSCKKIREGQLKKYAPYDKVFSITLKHGYDEKDGERILDFCQKHCHKCKYSDKELLAIRQNSELSFNEQMEAIVEGSYTISNDPFTKDHVTYKWSQDYLD